MQQKTHNLIVPLAKEFEERGVELKIIFLKKKMEILSKIKFLDDSL